MPRNRQEPQFGYEPADDEDVYLTASRERPATRGQYVETPRRRSYFPAIAVTIAFLVFTGLIWKSYRHHHITTASGQPPVITAEQTPVKIKPEHPGGTDMPYRDTTVYDQLAQSKQKTQIPAVEHLLQPPEEPLPKPVASAPEALPQPQAPVPEPQPEAARPPPVAASTASDQDLSSPTALAPQEPVPAATTPTPETALSPEATVAALIPPTPPEKPTPPPLSTASATPATVSASLPYAVQLGAFKDKETATSEWKRLQNLFPAQLGGLSPVIEQIDVPGKGALYRLRGGSLSAAQAKTTCDALKAQNVSCLVAAK